MPVVTRLKAASRKGSRTVVELDGEVWAEIDSEVVLRHGLRKENRLNEQELQALLADDAFIRARRAAAILLQTRPRSVAELRRRLLEKSFDPKTVERTLDHFTKNGDLDDERFARLFARNQFKTRRVGPMKVRHQLRRLGAPESAIEAALADEPAAQADAQTERAVAFLEKRLQRGAQKLSPRDGRAKMRAALLRAGFDPDVCRAALDRFSWKDFDDAGDRED